MSVIKNSQQTEQFPALPDKELPIGIERQTAQSGFEYEESKEQEKDISQTEIAPRPEGPSPGKHRHPRKTLQQVLPKRDEMSIKIEKILEEGLNDAYQRLSPVAKQEFKIKGEQTANAIRDILRGTKIKMKKIFRLILNWLRMLPGVNRFFLEQEAKIKTDKILELK